MNLKKEKRNLKCDMSQKLKKSERFEMWDESEVEEEWEIAEPETEFAEGEGEFEMWYESDVEKEREIFESEPEEGKGKSESLVNEGKQDLGREIVGIGIE
jgi:hypothetical protein